MRAEDCTSCGDCAKACPELVPNEFDMGLAWRKAIYLPFPQAVPSTYTLDGERCLNARLDSETGFRVLACDIDNTLVRYPDPPSPRVRDALQAARQAGVTVVLGVWIMFLAAGLLPALRASRLKPVDAMREQ